MIYLALGSNLGNRFENLRRAVAELKQVFHCEKISHVIETEALLLPGSPESWNIPYLNMMVAGDTDLSPHELLRFIKRTEEKLGRDMNAGRWAPRIIDIDIVIYNDQQLITDQLTLPHMQLENRDFWKYLLEMLGWSTGDPTVNDYRALNYFVLDPKIVKITNVTPDSFSDGGKFFNPADALEDIEKSYQNGAAYVELGAQSTRPGYTEVSAKEEIRRLEAVVTSVPKEIPLAIDTYFDEVVNFCLDHANIKIVNDIKFNLSDTTLRHLADNDVKIVTMLYGTDLSCLKNQVNHLKKCGLKHVIVDPGIGFGKTKFENLTILKNIKEIKSLGCEILIGHSRKSFFSLISNKEAIDRDIETLAVSDIMQNFGVDYLRIHNLEYHMKFFTAKKIMQP
ncbi:MAG: dihydropteroate synthase [Alphaproteobacteria bacterium]|nr:dihydropteroate synthase [Alphaproteobacteria bacterium]